jgi:hypothetical protein
MIGMEGLRVILIWYAVSGEQAYHFWKRLCSP